MRNVIAVSVFVGSFSPVFAQDVPHSLARWQACLARGYVVHSALNNPGASPADKLCEKTYLELIQHGYDPGQLM